VLRRPKGEWWAVQCGIVLKVECVSVINIKVLKKEYILGFFLSFFFIVVLGGECIAAFTEILTIYQIYHS
jgi:hypothetical protein